MQANSVDRTALLDGDQIAYQASANATCLDDAFDRTELLVRSWTSKAHCSDYYVCMTGRNEFRKKLHDDYKAQRGSKLDYVPEVKDFMRSSSRCQMHDELEADDIMGLLATSGHVENPVIVSFDKDMTTIPSWNFNPWRGCDVRKKRFADDFPARIEAHEAHMFWLKQMIHGDTSDNIKGIVGIGPSKAQLHISEHCQIPQSLQAEALYNLALNVYNFLEQPKELLDKTAILCSIWRNPMPKWLLEFEPVKSIYPKLDPFYRSEHELQ